MEKAFHNWKVTLRELESYHMELDEFMRLYPDISREQLAAIAGCKIATVHNWFATGSTHREPTEHHKLRFAIAHYLRCQEAAKAQEPPLFNDIRQAMQIKTPQAL